MILRTAFLIRQCRPKFSINFAMISGIFKLIFFIMAFLSPSKLKKALEALKTRLTPSSPGSEAADEDELETLNLNRPLVRKVITGALGASVWLGYSLDFVGIRNQHHLGLRLLMEGVAIFHVNNLFIFLLFIEN